MGSGLISFLALCIHTLGSHVQEICRAPSKMVCVIEGLVHALGSCIAEKCFACDFISVVFRCVSLSQFVCFTIRVSPVSTGRAMEWQPTTSSRCVCVCVCVCVCCDGLHSVPNSRFVWYRNTHTQTITSSEVSTSKTARSVPFPFPIPQFSHSPSLVPHVGRSVPFPFSRTPRPGNPVP